MKLHPPYIVTSREGRIITVACETISHAGVVFSTEGGGGDGANVLTTLSWCLLAAVPGL